MRSFKGIEAEKKKIEDLKKRLKVSDKRVWGMIETLLVHGYSLCEIAFLTQTGQTYSFAGHEIQAKLLNEGRLPGFSKEEPF
jgi:hypothetical protein